MASSASRYETSRLMSIDYDFEDSVDMGECAETMQYEENQKKCGKSQKHPASIGIFALGVLAIVGTVFVVNQNGGFENNGVANSFMGKQQLTRSTNLSAGTNGNSGNFQMSSSTGVNHQQQNNTPTSMTDPNYVLVEVPENRCCAHFGITIGAYCALSLLTSAIQGITLCTGCCSPAGFKTPCAPACCCTVSAWCLNFCTCQTFALWHAMVCCCPASALGCCCGDCIQQHMPKEVYDGLFSGDFGAAAGNAAANANAARERDARGARDHHE